MNGTKYSLKDCSTQLEIMSLSLFKSAYKQLNMSPKNSYKSLCFILKKENNFTPTVHIEGVFSLLVSMHSTFGFK